VIAYGLASAARNVAGVSGQKTTAPRMKARAAQESIAALCMIPGIGPSLARDLVTLGVQRVADLASRDPQALYEQLCAQTGQHHDRCVLYAFRCAVYFATTAAPDPQKLKWWHWKDAPGVAEKARKAAARRGLAPAGA
jgi:Pathogenicity locus